ncbi:MAG: hypothetical protein AAGU27_24825, partial [Dehalobacterium sp.]
ARRDQRYGRLRRLVKGAIEDAALSNDELAKLMGFKDEKTARKYRKYPELMPYQMLISVCAAVKVPLDELAGCVKY